MTCHVLHAGDGYTYLTRQVATGDVQRAGRDPLVDYYQASGNPPGEWAGSGCAELEVAGTVSEEQMLALFGEGLHPNANDLIASAVTAGSSYRDALRDVQLGRRFYQFDNTVPLVSDLREAYAEFEKLHDRRASVAERKVLKERAARARLVTAKPDDPPPSREQIRTYLTDELGKARQPVSGFDLVFSPVKSVSLLWALGGHRIREVVERVHEQAWRAALTFGEREASRTRVGANGVAFMDTSGFVVTAFVHRESRAGDPDLHTHLAVSNRVRGVDGRWRTVDSRQLHRVAVSMSERYNSLVEQGLVDALGARFIEVSKGPDKRSVREIENIPERWRTGFSTRRTQVEAGYDRLVRDYVRAHGRTPPRSVQHKLAQEATLTDRPSKTELRTLVEQITDWTQRAQTLTPGVDIPAVVEACVNRPDNMYATTGLADIADAVVTRIAQDRATWTVYHATAEAERQLRPLRFASAEHRARAVDEVVRTALRHHSVLLDVDTEAQPYVTPAGGAVVGARAESASLPSLLRHADGTSIFRRRGSSLYSSIEILAAEARLVEDARTPRGSNVPAAVRDAAILHWELTRNLRLGAGATQLNPGQRRLVEHFVSSGMALAVAIGPPGTGKSTAMAAVRAAWETTGGRVIGFAPSAVAAQVLGDELGVRADTLHSLLTKRITGGEIDVRAGDMLLVDEAGMAGTLILDDLCSLAEERGAVVRLVGDYRQLAAVEAGGALRLLHTDAGGVELSEVHRFADPDEATAVLQVRVGDETALDFYTDHNRLAGGTRTVMLDQLYQAWKNDTDTGRAAIMISDNNDVARELSALAQTERRASGDVDDHGVRLHDGTVAGVGDRVVTRRNKRRLTLFAGRDFVKNGDLWSVVKRYPDGRLTVRHLRHGGSIILPADYVANHVELGYAATIHRSQGLTVEIVRAFLSTTAVREAALVALSRGTHGNFAYLDTTELLHPDEPETLPGDLYYRHRNTAPTEEALRGILRRESAELSATDTLRAALEHPHLMSTLVLQYEYALHLHRGPHANEIAEQWVHAAVPHLIDEIVDDDAWPELARVLHELHEDGVNVTQLIAARAGQRAFHEDHVDPSRSVKQVLHWRIVADLPPPSVDNNRPVLLPGWVPSAPTRPTTSAESVRRAAAASASTDSALIPLDDPVAAAEYTQLRGWLHHHAQQIADRVLHLGERALDQQPAWTTDLGPIPTDPLDREQWIHCAGHVAAYRERWHIPDTDPDLLPPPPHQGLQSRAHAWVTDYVHDHPPRGAGDRATAARATAAANEEQQRAEARAAWEQDAAHQAHQQHLREQRAQERDRQRDHAATLLREVWRHDPDLVDTIIAAAGFDTLAARIADVTEAGHDIHEVLAEVPLHRVVAHHIRQPATYAVTLVDIAVERVRSGQAQHDADRRAQQRAEHEAFAQMCDQAADLIREHWEARPDLADTVINSTGFDALVRRLDYYDTAGLGVRALLDAVPLAKIDAPDIRHKPEFAIYLLTQHATRALRDLDDQQQAAAAHAERLARRDGAAAILRQAWANHPKLADLVINGAAFRHLADRMFTAQQAGHKTYDLLRGLNPLMLTAPHVLNPAGTAAFAFTQALARNNPEPSRAPTRPTRATTPSLQPPAQAPNQPQTPEPNPPHWTQRTFGDLADEELHNRTADRQHALQQLIHERQRAEQGAAQLRAVNEAGRSPHVLAVDHELAHLQHQLRRARQLDELQTQWNAATNRLADAAEQRSRAESELDRLGRLTRSRRESLTQQIDNLRSVEHREHLATREFATQIARFREQSVDDVYNLHQLEDRAAAAELTYPAVREAADQRAHETADRALGRALELKQQEPELTRYLRELHAEAGVRDHLPGPARQQEERERTLKAPLTREQTELPNPLPAPAPEDPQPDLITDRDVVADAVEAHPGGELEA